MKSFKILVETNVLLSASILHSAKEIDIKLEHHFYNYCRPLISFLKKNIDKRIGLITPTIETEAKSRIGKAVLETLIEALQKDKIEDHEKRKTIFNYYVAITNICSDKLNEHISILQRDPISPEEKSKWFIEVSRLYEDMKDYAKSVDLNRYAKIQSEYVPRKFKHVAEQIYKTQLAEEMGPIRRLKKRPVGSRDKEILAEAICLQNHYKCDLFLASTDQHLSPVRLPNGKKLTTLTDEIKKRFNIDCDWPDMILEKIRSS